MGARGREGRGLQLYTLITKITSRRGAQMPNMAIEGRGARSRDHSVISRAVTGRNDRTKREVWHLQEEVATEKLPYTNRLRKTTANHELRCGMQSSIKRSSSSLQLV